MSTKDIQFPSKDSVVWLQFILLLVLLRNSASILSKEESSIVEYVFDNTGKKKIIQKKTI